MKKINLENYNEFETDYITDKFNEVNEIEESTYDNLKVNGDNIYYPTSFVEEKGEEQNDSNGYNGIGDTIKFTDYELLTTKEEMLSAWTKEEHPELY